MICFHLFFFCSNGKCDVGRTAIFYCIEKKNNLLFRSLFFYDTRTFQHSEFEIVLLISRKFFFHIFKFNSVHWLFPRFFFYFFHSSIYFVISDSCVKQLQNGLIFKGGPIRFGNKEINFFSYIQNWRKKKSSEKWEMNEVGIVCYAQHKP